MNEATVRGAGPLYAQVIDLITARLTSGAWRPGQLIPGESRLASELQVSQGTVRKAVDDLVARNLLVRQQGVGTFVAEHDSHRALFHFFHIVASDGSRSLPDAHVLLPILSDTLVKSSYFIVIIFMGLGLIKFTSSP